MLHPFPLEQWNCCRFRQPKQPAISCWANAPWECWSRTLDFCERRIFVGGSLCCCGILRSRNGPCGLQQSGPKPMRTLFGLLSHCLLLIIAGRYVAATEPLPAEKADARRWVAAKFE